MKERDCLSYDWSFIPKNLRKVKSKNMRKTVLMPVFIPHTPRLESLTCVKPLQTKMWYRRNLIIPITAKSHKIYLEFEGVMCSCKVYLNGRKVGEHKGGYLPFNVDISKAAKFGGDNILSVMVDNRDDKNIPPGKPTSKVDFLYYGGIYRDVWLNICDIAYFTQNGKNAGIYIFEKTVTKERVVIGLNAFANFKHKNSNSAEVRCTVYDRQGELINSFISLAKANDKKNKKPYEVTITLDNPLFWTPSHPYLYTFVIELFLNGNSYDVKTIKHGIRTFALDHRGFLLNNSVLKINGANRHQQFPYLGLASSENAEYRDAYIIKNAGFNAVRLAHYPQSEAFLDACDELGLMVINCVPGWQFCRFGEFKDRVVDNIKDMARRDRNHTCIVMWETSLNETGVSQCGATDNFFIECKEALLKEFPYGEKPLTSGDTNGRKNPAKINYDIPYTQEDNISLKRHLNSLPTKGGLAREYGDFEFGGNLSTTRVGRGDGEGAMLLQAWNYQWSHNRNLNVRNIIGDLIWEAIDHVRGCSQIYPISKSGILDIFRLPKFSYHFYRSQDRRLSKKMVFVPTYWNDDKLDVLPVYSNCEKVKLYINGEFVEERIADSGKQDEYNQLVADEIKNIHSKRSYATAPKRFWALAPGHEVAASKMAPIVDHLIYTMYNGNNCNRLAFPPFTFKNINFCAGELKAEGIVGDNVVATHIVKTPNEPVQIRIKINYSGRALKNDGKDFVFAYAEIVDENGTIVPINGEKIDFEINGGILIGEQEAVSEAGIATVLLKAERGSTFVEIKASTPDLCSKIYGIKLDNCTE